MIDLTINNTHYKGLDEGEFAEYVRMKNRDDGHPQGVWSLRQTYKYIHRDYKWMNCILQSEDGKRLLKGIVIPGKGSGARYEVRIVPFLKIWDNYGAEMIQIAQRMRPLLYPDKRKD